MYFYFDYFFFFKFLVIDVNNKIFSENNFFEFGMNTCDVLNDLYSKKDLEKDLKVFETFYFSKKG